VLRIPRHQVQRREAHPARRLHKLSGLGRRKREEPQGLAASKAAQPRGVARRCFPHVEARAAVRRDGRDAATCRRQGVDGAAKDGGHPGVGLAPAGQGQTPHQGPADLGVGVDVALWGRRHDGEHTLREGRNAPLDHWPRPPEGSHDCWVAGKDDVGADALLGGAVLGRVEHADAPVVAQSLEALRDGPERRGVGGGEEGLDVLEDSQRRQRLCQARKVAALGASRGSIDAAFALAEAADAPAGQACDGDRRGGGGRSTGCCVGVLQQHPHGGHLSDTQRGVVDLRLARGRTPAHVAVYCGDNAERVVATRPHSGVSVQPPRRAPRAADAAARLVNRDVKRERLGRGEGGLAGGCCATPASGSGLPESAAPLQQDTQPRRWERLSQDGTKKGV
jgi:hypothetical protein